MTFTPSYAQIDSPDPVNAQDLATKNYVDTRPRYGCRYTSSALTSPATPNTAQAVPFTTRIYDQGPYCVGGIYTCPVAGRYITRVSVSASLTSGQTINAMIYKNGGSICLVPQFNGTAGNAATIAQAVDIALYAAGDTIEAFWQTTVASVALRGPQNETFLAIDYLGPP